ncbi:tetratricopeptide repeat protein [Thalassotalea nanhaiensis]|uniref:Tetratricopeptide repeat protein n=1 Tax=Thalassotalea nanhaiensis TaxID=3065648 RepID=A0ABY9TGE3_9GAMM|nr:tetratricopeptide repeat protein [Colwelliaceae bacterium SQ345]
MSDNTIAISPENFQQVILEESKTKLILVHFWADQIPESVELRDKLAGRVVGAEKFMTLATVDCAAQQAIAQQFGIQALPTSVIVKDGQPIDGISGPQPDQAIDEFLGKYLPKPEDSLLAQGLDLLQQQQVNDALSPLQQAFAIDSERADIKKALADVYLHLGKIAEAEELLSTILMVEQDSYYQSLIAKLELAQEASNSPEIQALEQQLAANPDDIELSRQLAVQYSQVNRHEEALNLLYKLLVKDAGDSESKKLLLDILSALPDGDKLAAQYRRKLFAMMY